MGGYWWKGGEGEGIVFASLEGEVQTQIKTIPLSCSIHLVGEGARRAGEVIGWGDMVEELSDMGRKPSPRNLNFGNYPSN